MAPNSPSHSLSPTTKRAVVYLSLALLAVGIYWEKMEGERIERSVRAIYDANERGREMMGRAIENFRKRAVAP